jgi:sugar phosphate permease
MGIDKPSLCRRTSLAECEYIEKGQRTEQQAGTIDGPGGWRELVGLKKIWVLVLAYCAVTSTGWGLMTWLPSYFVQARGFSWQEMSYLTVLPYLAKGAGALIIGVVSDRLRHYGRAPFYCLGLLLMSFFIFLGVTVTNSWWSLVMVILANFFFAFTAPTAWAILQTAVPGHLTGSGAGLMNGVANTVSSMSPLLIGAIIGATGSYYYGLMYLVGWGLVGVGCTAVLVLRRL